MRKQLLLPFILIVFINELFAQDKGIREINTLLCDRVSTYAPDSILAEKRLNSNTGTISLETVKDSLDQEGIALSDEIYFYILGERLNYPDEIYNFYQQRSCETSWFNINSGFQNADTLMSVLNQVDAHGLKAEHYHLDTLSAIYNKLVMLTSLEKPIKEDELLDFEILMTDAAISYAHDMRIGSIKPTEVELNFDIAQDTAYVAEDLISALNAESLNDYYMGIAPYFDQYEKLQIVLDDYVEKAKVYTDWTNLPDGETIKPGMTDDRLPYIKYRLEVLASGDDTGETLINIDSSFVRYDSLFVDQIKDFQLRHGLTPDGEIGKGTIKALNMNLKDRVQALSINLERWRWMPRNIGDRYIIVNIAGYFMQVYDADTVSFTKKVVVGKPYTSTPVFSDIISYIEFNPTWNVPYSIRSKEILPKLKNNPAYLDNQNMVLLSGGRRVDPYSVDWYSINASNFPYGVRQEPGRSNALGTMKFMFPNKYDVYLHDTPSKSKFNRYTRAFSHGCVRLHKPKELADYLLSDQYSAEKIQKILNRRKTKRVNLTTPVPIFIMYWSVWVDEEGNPYFMQDVYKRDEAVKKVYFSGVNDAE